MPADKNLIATEHPDVETEYPTSIAQSQSWDEEDVPSEKQAAEVMKAIRELQSRLFTGGRKFTREEMNER